MNYLKNLPGKVKFNEPLKKHTTLGVGGEAKAWCQPANIEVLRAILKLARKEKTPVSIIGVGSNILIGDKGLKHIVINLAAANFRKINFDKTGVHCGTGVKLPVLLNKAFCSGFGGLEFLTGIPATVGGAIFMNAGIAKNKNIGNLVTDISVMDYNGNIKTLKKKDLKFAYRRSNIAKFIILNAHLKLVKKDKNKIKQSMLEYRSVRRQNQDTRIRSIGCIFKNPDSYKSAGYLIDSCNLKGRSIGGASISKKHANFILNRNKAKAKDVLELISLMKKKVKSQFGISLEAEIKIWH